MERTLILLKPDAVQRGLVGAIMERFEKKGLRFAAMKMLKMTPDMAKDHYSHLTSKPFYPDLEKFMTSGPIVAAVVEGKEAVEVVRGLCGPTNATKAPAGTIRGDFSNSTSRNVIHASDSRETAAKEIARFFKDSTELFECAMNRDLHYASDE